MRACRGQGVWIIQGKNKIKYTQQTCCAQIYRRLYYFFCVDRVGHGCFCWFSCCGGGVGVGVEVGGQHSSNNIGSFHWLQRLSFSICVYSARLLQQRTWRRSLTQNEQWAHLLWWLTGRQAARGTMSPSPVSRTMSDNDHFHRWQHPAITTHMSRSRLQAWAEGGMVLLLLIKKIKKTTHVARLLHRMVTEGWQFLEWNRVKMLFILQHLLNKEAETNLGVAFVSRPLPQQQPSLFEEVVRV